MQTPDLCVLIVNALENNKAKDIAVLDVQQLTDTTDKMIISSGTSGRHIAALAQAVHDELGKKGILPLSSEGEDTMEWILIDYLHVVVHLMKSETRNYYDLESLWDTRLTRAKTGASASARTEAQIENEIER